MKKALKWIAIILGILILVIGLTPVIFWLTLDEYKTSYTFSNEPEDGIGEATIQPSVWEVGEWNTEQGTEELLITYRVGENGMPEGSALRINFGHLLDFNGEQRLYIPLTITAVSAIFFDIDLYQNPKVQTDGDAELEVTAPSWWQAFTKLLGLIKYKRTEDGLNNPDNLMQSIDREYCLEIKIVEGELKPGDSIMVQLGNVESGQGLKSPHRMNELELVVSTDGNGNGTFKPIENCPILKVIATEPKQLHVIAPSNPIVGEPFTVLVKATDNYYLPNIISIYDSQIIFEYDYNIEGPTFYQFNPQVDEGLHEFEFTIKQEGIYRITVKDENGLIGISNPMDTRPVEKPIVWGDMHSHSIISYDADSTPDYVFQFHRDINYLDFACLSDHDLIGITPFVERRGFLGRTQEEWDYMQQISDKYNDPGRFVAIKGFEWTHYSLGHRNVYYPPWEINLPLYCHSNPDFDNPDKLAAALKNVDCLIIPHSPAWATQAHLEMTNQFDWGTQPIPQQRVVEIYSCHGASEYYDNPYAVDKGLQEAPTDSELILGLMNYIIAQAPPDSGNFVQDALANGWRLGFIGCSDMHYLAYTRQAYKQGITGAFVNELSRAGVYEALYNRESYATTNCRMIIYFYANDIHPMGSEITLSSNQSPIFKMEVIGTDTLSKVELIKYDGDKYSTLFSAEPNSDYFSQTVSDVEFSSPSFYYLRVTQKDGNMGWASPIWID